MITEEINQLATRVLDAAFAVHRGLGPGLLESVYEQCLCHELRKQGIRFETQVVLPIRYDGVEIEAGLRLDIFVERQIILELKAADGLLPIHEAQLLTYLKLTDCKLGYLLNFNKTLLKDGIKRIAH